MAIKRPATFATRDRLRNLWPDLLALGFLVLAGIKLTAGIDRAFDILLSDEAKYLYQGIHLADEGFPAPQWSPLYALWYFLLSQFTGDDRVLLYYLSFALISTAIPLLLYVYLRRIQVRPVLALAVAFFYLVSYANLAIWPYPAKFAILNLLVFLILATFGSAPTRIMWLMIGLLTTAYIRPEYYPAYLLFVAGALVYGVLRAWRDGLEAVQQAWRQVLVVLVLTVLFLVMMDNPLQGGRSAVAFQQHFAVNYVEWFDLDQINPWRDWPQISFEAFGGFSSIAEAAQSNPQLFVRHLLQNIAAYGEGMRQVLTELGMANRLLGLDRQATISAALRAIVALVLVASAAVNVIWARRGSAERRGRRRWTIPALSGPVKGRAATQLLLVLALVMLPSASAAIIVYPRFHYLQLQSFLLTILLTLFVSGTLDLLPLPKPGLRGRLAIVALCGACVLVLTPNLADGWILLSRPTAPPWLDTTRTIRFLRELAIEEDVGLLTHRPFDYLESFLPANLHKVSPDDKVDSLASFVEDTDLALIVWPDEFLALPNFRQDEGFARLLAEPAAFGFEALVVPDTRRNSVVLVRQDLVPAAAPPAATPPADSAVEPLTADEAPRRQREADRLLQAGRYREAIPLLVQLAAFDPSDLKTRLDLAAALHGDGRLEEALREYERINVQWPDAAWAYAKRGAVLEELGQGDAALAAYEEAVKRAPDEATLHFLLGYAYRRANRPADSLAAFEAGLRVDPARDDIRALTEELRSSAP